jgi:hypothetical protein
LLKVNNTQKLSTKQRKAIDTAVSRARPKGSDRKPETAQQSIPFKQMYKDGICRVDKKTYNKTVQFFDITYCERKQRTCEVKVCYFRD